MGDTIAYLDHPGIVAMAHRGFSLAGLENSMAAFEAAVELGYRYVETDTHATSDGVAVAVHDPTLDRVTDRIGVIAQLPWRTVSQALIGGREPIPRLDELLHAWPTLRINIDVKSDSAVAPTVAAIERAQAHDRVCIGSFSDRRRRETLRRLSRPVARSAGQIAGAGFRLGSALPHRLGHRITQRSLRHLDAVQLPAQRYRVPLVTGPSVDAAHRAGLVVHVWTINDVAEMNALLDLGVDGLISDRADLLKDVLIQRGQWAETG
ncbi:MAG: glycerophosphodiester phosphodiesterase family protein [Ornithinimicrobium sp.]